LEEFVELELQKKNKEWKKSEEKEHVDGVFDVVVVLLSSFEWLRKDH
jgi:hypothetical protein